MTKKKRQNWVFGYGSLVNSISVQQTLQRSVDPGRDILPVFLNGFVRSWCVSSAGLRGRTYLGIERVPDYDCRVLGVLIRAFTANRDLDKLDVREGLYRRVELPVDMFEAFGEWEVPRNARIMTYLPQFRITPDPSRNYVSKSYLSIVVAGVKSWGDAFVSEFEVEQPRSLPIKEDLY